MSFTPFDLLNHKHPLNFKLGPSKFKMSEVGIESDRYFSIPQLFMIFTDLRNLLFGRQGPDVSVVEDQQEDPEGGSEDINRSDGILSPIQMRVKPFDRDAIIENENLEVSKNQDSENREDDDNILNEGVQNDQEERSESAFKKMEIFSVEEVVQRLRIRVKNNSLGLMHYFPEKWDGSLSFTRLQVPKASIHSREGC